MISDGGIKFTSNNASIKLLRINISLIDRASSYKFANCKGIELWEPGKQDINNKEGASTVEGEDAGNNTREKVAAST